MGSRVANIFKILMSKLFHTRSEDERAIDEVECAVDSVMRDLPRCSQSVITASPAYGDPHLKGDVIADTRKLLDWLEAATGESGYWSLQEKVARSALKTWLKAADTMNEVPTSIHSSMTAFLQSHTYEFVKSGIASVYCRQCELLWTEILMNTLNKRDEGPYSYWTDDWRCPRNHVLYYADRELHILRRKSAKQTTPNGAKSVDVHVLDPQGNYSRSWEIGKDISSEIYDQAKDRETGALYAITSYEEGTATIHVCTKDRWLQFKEQFDAIENEGAEAMAATREKCPDLFR